MPNRMFFFANGRSKACSTNSGVFQLRGGLGPPGHTTFDVQFADWKVAT